MENFKVLNAFVKNGSHKREDKSKVFGSELNAYMETQKKHLAHFLNVPLLIRVCADEIILRGLHLEGLFRVPGNSNVIQEICKAFEEGRSIDLSAMDIEDISGAYKKYIRDLPAPLFTDDGDRTTEKLVSQVPDYPSLHEQLFLLKSIVSNLSVYRRALAFEFFYLLYLVSLRSDQNFMTATNLATIFGGMINVISSTLSGSAKTDLACLLISHFPYIFCDQIPSDMTPDEIETLKAKFDADVKKFESVSSDVPTTEATGEGLSAIKIYTLNGQYTVVVVKASTTAAHIKKLLDANSSSSSARPFHLYSISDRHVSKLVDTATIVSNISTVSSLFWTNSLDENVQLYVTADAETKLFHGPAFVLRKNSDSTLAEATAGELDMTGVSLADDIVSKFSLICLDLQRMLPKINVHLLSVRDENSMNKFTGIKEALEVAKTFIPQEKTRAAARAGRGAAWMLARTAITENIMALQKRVNVLLTNCTASGVSDIEATILSLEGLNVYRALLNAFEEYERANAANVEKNVLNVEIIDAKDVTLEETQVPQIVLLLDDEPIGKTRALKPYKNLPLDLVWNEAFELRLSRASQNLKLKLMDPELCLAELSSSIEDISIGSSQESWLAFFPEGYSKLGNSLVHIVTAFSVSPFNPHVGNLNLTVEKCTNTQATELSVVLMQSQASTPTEMSNTKKGKIVDADTLWDETFTFHVDRSQVKKSEIIISFKKNKKTISQSRISLATIIDAAEEPSLDQSAPITNSTTATATNSNAFLPSAKDAQTVTTPRAFTPTSPTSTNERRNTVSTSEADEPALNVSTGLSINLAALGEKSSEQNFEGEMSFEGLSPRSFGKKIKMSSDANKPVRIGGNRSGIPMEWREPETTTDGEAEEPASASHNASATPTSVESVQAVESQASPFPLDTSPSRVHQPMQKRDSEATQSSTSEAVEDKPVRPAMKKRISAAKLNDMISTNLRKRAEQTKTQRFQFRLYPIPPKNLGLLRVSFSHSLLTILPTHHYQPFIQQIVENHTQLIPLLEQLSDSNAELKKILTSIVPVLLHENVLLPVLQDLIASEANAVGTQLLLGESSLTFMLEIVVRLYCQNYISKLMQPLQKILESDSSCVIAGKLTGDEYKRNLHFLTSSLKAIWAEVVNNISLIPPTIRKIFFTLKNILSPGYNDKTFFVNLGHLFINQYISQVLANPKKYALGDTLSLNETYNLGIISSVISHLGTFSPFPSGNPLVATNSWMNSTFPICQHLLDQISTPSSTLQVERVSIEFENSVAESLEFFIHKQSKQVTVPISAGFFQSVASLAGVLAK